MSGVARAQAEQRKYRSLTEELVRIGNLIESGKSRLKSLQVNETEETRILERLPKLRQQEKDLLESIARLRGAETEAINGTQRAQKAHRKISTAYRDTSDLHTSAVGRQITLKRQVEVLEGYRESIVAANREKGRQSISKSDPVLVAMNRVLASIRAEIVEAKKDLASMSQRQKQSQNLSATLRNLNVRQRKLERDTTVAEKILRQKKDQINLIDHEIEKKRLEHDAVCAKMLADIEAEKTALAKREGRINRTVEWLKHRAGLLAQAKRELEDFRGKDLSHIIIPDVSDLE